MGIGVNSPAESEDPMVVDGDWYIAANQEFVIKNRSIILNGNIIINGTGKLVITNVSLKFNNTIYNSFNIFVRNKGTLLIEESVISSTSVPACSKITFMKDSFGSITNTKILNLGDAPADFSGIFIESNDVLLKDCSVQNCTYGIFLNASSPSIENVNIDNCKVGIYGLNTKSTIQNSTIKNCITSILLEDKSNLTTTDSVFENPNLNNTSKLFSKNILDLQIIFNKPYFKPIKYANILVVNNGNILYSTERFSGTDSCTNENGRIKSLLVTQKLYSGKKKTNYSTEMSVKYKSRAKLNKQINFIPCKSEIVTFENNPPILSYPNINPNSGYSEDTYSYSILYLDPDNDPPGRLDVEIDDEVFPMINKDSNYDWRNGTWFEYKTTLALGEHKFRFIANDNLSFPDIYMPENKIDYLSGPTVEIKNSEPELKYGSVSPEIGNLNTEFSYQVQYFDADNDPPLIAKVYIDNLPHDMTQRIPEDSGDSRDTDACPKIGLWFEFSTRLTIGEHSFYFKFKDDNGSSVISWPGEDDEDEVGVISGPVVNDFENKPPQLGNGSVSPKYGHRLIRFSYTISYYDPEGDIPTIAIVVIDGEAFNLTRARIAQNIYFYETFLAMGEHYFHFEFWDAEHKHFVRYPAGEFVEIVGPIVVDLPPVLEEGEVTPDIGTAETLFEFSLKYTDPENDWPELASVVIGNDSFNLSIHENEAGNGESSLFLSYSTQLPLGEYSFYFIIQSGMYILQYPSVDSFYGPTALNGIDIPSDPKHPKQKNSTTTNATAQNTINNTSTESESEPEPKTDENKPSVEDQGTNEILAKFEVLEYSIKELPGRDGIEYMFFVNCHIPEELLNNCMCWVYINGESYFMNIKKNFKENVTRFVLNIKLADGEHSYHFLFKMGSDVRYPYLGEFRGPVVGELGVAQESTERGSEKPNYGNIQIIAILVLFLSFIIFSIYYTYFAPKKRLL